MLCKNLLKFAWRFIKLLRANSEKSEQLFLIPEKELEFHGEYRRSHSEEWLEKFTEWLGGYELCTYQETFRMFDELEIECNEVEINNKIIGLTFDWKGKKYFLEFDKPNSIDALEYSNEVTDNPKLAREFIENLDYDNLDQYFDDNFSSEFWSDPVKLYHATTPENKNKVLKQGLKVQNNTRGLSNAHIGASVFTSMDPNSIESYGSLVFEIDTLAMKANGYTPELEEEPDIRNEKRINYLAEALGVENYIFDIEDGMDPNTVIIYGNIPTKYIEIYSE